MKIVFRLTGAVLPAGAGGAEEGGNGEGEQGRGSRDLTKFRYEFQMWTLV